MLLGTCGNLQIFSTRPGLPALYKNEKTVFLRRIAASSDLSATIIPISDITSKDIKTIRCIDEETRHQFTHIPYSVDIHLLQSPAGSGKTTCCIDLAKHLDIPVLCCAYTIAAQQEGASRTVEYPNIMWCTLDSTVFQFMEPRGEFIDMDDVTSFGKLVQKILKRPMHMEEIQHIQNKLRFIFDNDRIDQASGEIKKILNAAFFDEWWCYASLRLAAFHQKYGWIQHMKDKCTAVIVDESQDLNPILLKLILLLKQTHMIVFTGDSAQKIFDFNGCIDVRDKLRGIHFTEWKLYLTYRFGEQVCNYINKRQLGVISTYPARDSQQTQIRFVDTLDASPIPGPHTVLMRGWYDILLAADLYLQAGRKVTIVPFEKKQQILDSFSDPGYTHRNYFLIRNMGRPLLQDILDRIVEDTDDIIISTVHSFKGSESDNVRVGNCIFFNKKNKESLYVALTRARKLLILPFKN